LDCPDGFMDFVSATAPRLRRTAYLLCGDWHTAQDLTQATLVRVFMAWRRIRDPGSAHAYAQRTPGEYLPLWPPQEEQHGGGGRHAG
jgi:DNA-directed RNA polymerase specialized sigma24 family protein